MTNLKAYVGADIFDGHTRHTHSGLLINDGHVADIVSTSEVPNDYGVVKLDGGMLTAGFVDLQVNGGGGAMLNNAPSVDGIRAICDAHLQFGTTSLLPTLITDTKAQTNAAIMAVKEAIAKGISGAIGLHLEGPHLSIARKGAHDPQLIRSMEDEDCRQLCALAAELPSLLLTLAPESVTLPQISDLSTAGATVSLGHSDADYQTACSAAAAGATCVTHLFNAMSQLGNRTPGMVGATLDTDSLYAGLIADGIHVDPAVIRIAQRAKQGEGRLFLVTDSMATVGTDMREFSLGGRSILRRDGRLTLSDGTLAGADLDMASAVRFMITEIGLDAEEALRMASLYPARLLKRDHEIGSLVAGARADFVHLDGQMQIKNVWREGVEFSQS
ncbi:N-acetylglucosamine-6-phosphate deacetylase [Rhodobacterales bacterium 52_120_T64]|nr:N-acetylglucosamine-6-phosphate deacetylase [Rhodobacterales bacterium 52_120_T64]